MEQPKRLKKAPVQVSEAKKKPSKRPRSNLEGSEVEKKEEEGFPTTWARRRRPKTEQGALKWDTLRAVFIEHIKPHLSAISVHEVRGVKKTVEN